MNPSDRSSDFDSSYGGGYHAPEDMTALDLLDRTIAALPIGDPVRKALLNVRAQIVDQEDTINEARQTIEKMEEVIKKVTSPANRIGTFLGSPNRETAQIVVGGSDYYCNCDPRINLSKLKKGNARAGQRSLRHRRRTRLRHQWPGDQDHRSDRHGPSARRAG